jgi:hypothetical protein
MTMMFPILGIVVASNRYSNWMKSRNIDFKTMVSVNATMIAGTLIFLTVSNLGRNITLTGLFDPDELFTISTRSLINALAALTIIPFSASSILLLLWGPDVGSEPVEHIHDSTGKSVYSNTGTPTDRSVHPAVKMGTIYMIAGFVWIITTMGVLLSLAATPDVPTFPYMPTILTNAIDRNGTNVTYTNPTAVDTEDGKNITVTCDPPSGSHFPIKDSRVKCTAIDKDGNAGVGFFKVTVKDTPPDTKIKNATVDGNTIEWMVPTFSNNITFMFDGQDTLGAAAFECNMYSRYNETVLDFSSCDSPISYTNITSAGIHTFEVRAIDINDQADETPAIFKWNINK